MIKKLLNDETVGGMIFIAFSLFFIIIAVDYKIGNVVNGIWQPGAGFYPLLAGWLVMAVGVILVVRGVIRAWRPGKQEAPAEVTVDELTGEVKEVAPLTREEQRANTRILVLTILTIFAMLVLWQFIGFYPSAVLMCLALNALYKDKPLVNVLLTVCLIAFVFAGFTLGLNISFRV